MNTQEKITAWAQKRLANTIARGGSMVTDEHARARKAICGGCPKSGKVKIEISIFTVEAEGCIECGCPFATKPYINEILRDITKKENSPITPAEIMQAQSGLKETRLEKVICPHPEGNKWTEIDKIFES